MVDPLYGFGFSSDREGSSPFLYANNPCIVQHVINMLKVKKMPLLSGSCVKECGNIAPFLFLLAVKAGRQKTASGLRRRWQ